MHNINNTLSLTSINTLSIKWKNVKNDTLQEICICMFIHEKLLNRVQGEGGFLLSWHDNPGNPGCCPLSPHSHKLVGTGLHAGQAVAPVCPPARQSAPLQPLARLCPMPLSFQDAHYNSQHPAQGMPYESSALLLRRWAQTASGVTLEEKTKGGILTAETPRGPVSLIECNGRQDTWIFPFIHGNRWAQSNFKPQEYWKGFNSVGTTGAEGRGADKAEMLYECIQKERAAEQQGDKHSCVLTISVLLYIRKQ